MEKRFRALRLIALVWKVLAWVVLAAGILLAIGVVILGLVQGRAGVPSALVREYPFLGRATGLLGTLITGVGMFLGTVLCFVLFYAAGQAVDLGLAIEQNTREAAHYLRGEGTLPPPPRAV